MLDVIFPAAVLRMVVGDRNEPFVLSAEEAALHAPAPDGIAWPDLALAPLWTDETLQGLISVRERSPAGRSSRANVSSVVRAPTTTWSSCGRSR